MHCQYFVFSILTIEGCDAMYAEVFASRLKNAREYHGYTQTEVAETLKVSQSTYNKYEKGKSEPGIEMIALLCKLYQVNSDWLIGLSSDSGLKSIKKVIQDRERQKMLEKMEKEAERNLRVWG